MTRGLGQEVQQTNQRQPKIKAEQQKRLSEPFRERDKKNAEGTRIYREQQEAWRANMLRPLRWTITGLLRLRRSSPRRGQCAELEIKSSPYRRRWLLDR
jgi:hypothetical protein